MQVSNKTIVDWLMPKNKTIRFELLSDIGHSLEKRGNPDQVIVKTYLQLSQCAFVKAKRLTPEEIALNLRTSSGRTILIEESGQLKSSENDDDVSDILKYSGSKCNEDLSLSTKPPYQSLFDDDSSIEIRLSADSNTNSPKTLEDDEVQVEKNLNFLIKDKPLYIKRVTDKFSGGKSIKNPNVQKIQSVLDESIDEQCSKESRGTHVNDIIEKFIDRSEEVDQSVKHSSNNNEYNQEKNREIKSSEEQLILESKSQINNRLIHEINTDECKKKEHLFTCQPESVKNISIPLKNYENDQESQVADKSEFNLFTKEENAGKTGAKVNDIEKHFLDICIEGHKISPENHSSTLGCNENISSLKDQVKSVYKTDNVLKYIPTSGHLNKVQISKLQERLKQNLKNKRSGTSFKTIGCESDYRKKTASHNKTILENSSESKPQITVRKNLFNPPNNKEMQQDVFMTGNFLNSCISANENALQSSDLNEKLFSTSKKSKNNSLKLQTNIGILGESEDMSMSTNDINSGCHSNENHVIRWNQDDKMHQNCPSSVQELEKSSNSKTKSNKLFSKSPQTDSFEAELQQFTSQVKCLDQHLTSKKRAAHQPVEIEKKSKMRRFSDYQIRPASTLNSTSNIYNSSKNKIKNPSNLQLFSEQSIRSQITLHSVSNNFNPPSTKSDLLPLQPEITLRSLLNSPSDQGTITKQKELATTSIGSIQNPLKNTTNEKNRYLKQLLQVNKNKMVKDKSGLMHCKQAIGILANADYSMNTTDIIINNSNQKNSQTTFQAHSSQITPKIREITAKSDLVGEVNEIVSDNTVSSSTVFDSKIEKNLQNKLQSNEMLQEEEINQVMQPVGLSEYQSKNSVQNESCSILHTHKEAFIDSAVDLLIDFLKLDDQSKFCVPSEVLFSILQYIQTKATNIHNINLHYATRSYLELYTKYIDESVGTKINKIAELLHLGIADWNRRRERKTRALRLTSELLRKEEMNRADNDYKEMLSLRGIKFSEIFLSVLNHFKDCVFVLLASLFFRITIALMKIDKENINYVYSVRSLILSLLKNGTIELNEACNRFLSLQNQEYNNTYNFVKQCLVSLCIVGYPISEAKDILKYAHTDPFPIQLEQMKSILIAKKQASAAADVQVGNTIPGENELITPLTSQVDTLLHHKSSVLNRGLLQKTRLHEQTMFQADASMTSTKQNIPNEPSSSQQRSYDHTIKLNALKQGLQRKILTQLPQHQTFQNPNLQQIIQVPENERNIVTSQTPLYPTFHNHLSQHNIMHESGIVVTAQNDRSHENDIVDKADRPPYSQPYAGYHNCTMNSMEVPELRYCSRNGCSQLATLACGLCKAVLYCTRDCQTKDWYSGEHSRFCLG